MSAPAAPPLQLAVLISGRGSNMLAIARACASGYIAGRIVTVIGDRVGATGLAAARELGLATKLVDASTWRGPAGFDRAGFEAALRQQIDAAGADLVVLAGFMRVLSADFVHRYTGRILNIHPSLLPAYPGLDTHARALAAGDREHGASVHYVTPELDAGPPLLQARVPVLPGDTVDSLSARVHAVEHKIYPEVIRWIAAGRLHWCAGRPQLDGVVLDGPRQWAED
ncbi:MAG: phosphoribosylglycinamide formyltransferase [Steroidobacteraceae bacterium]